MEDVRITRRLSATKAIIFSLVPILVLLVSAEVALRIWAYYFRTSYERYSYARGRLELVPNIQFTTAKGEEFRINSKGFVGPDFTDVKPQGMYRIFALGDSCTFGDGYWRRAYPAMLEQLLDSADHSRRFEVINAGIEGYDSEYALARLSSELVAYGPDMVIVYIGWNDLMKLDPQNAAAVGRHAWLARLMEGSYLIKGYKKLLFFYLRPLVIRPKPDGDKSDVHAFDQFVPLRFQGNLESMVEALQARRIEPILLTLPTAVESHMSDEELERRHIVFPYYAGSYSVGRFLSLQRAYNRVIRKVALKYAVPLVDLDEVFNSYNKSTLFWDTMHPSLKGHVLIANSILETVRKLRVRRGQHAIGTESVRRSLDSQ